MIITTEKINCKTAIYDEDAIIFRIEDQAAGPYLSVYSQAGAAKDDTAYGITFETKSDLDTFYNTAINMLDQIKNMEGASANEFDEKR